MSRSSECRWLKRITSFMLASVIGVGGSIPLLLGGFGLTTAEAYSRTGLFGNPAYDNTVSELLKDNGWKMNEVEAALYPVYSISGLWSAPRDMTTALAGKGTKAEVLQAQMYKWVADTLVKDRATLGGINTMTGKQKSAHEKFIAWAQPTNPEFISWATLGFQNRYNTDTLADMSSIIAIGSKADAEESTELTKIYKACKNSLVWFFASNKNGFTSALSMEDVKRAKAPTATAKATWPGIGGIPSDKIIEGLLTLRTVYHIAHGNFDILRATPLQYGPYGGIDENVLWDPLSTATPSSGMLITKLLGGSNEYYLRSTASFKAYGKLGEALTPAAKVMGLTPVAVPEHSAVYTYTKLTYEEAVAKWKTAPALVQGLLLPESGIPVDQNIWFGAWGSPLNTQYNDSLKLDYNTFYTLKTSEYVEDSKEFFTNMVSFLMDRSNKATYDWFIKNYDGTRLGQSIDEDEMSKAFAEYLFGSGYTTELESALSYFNQKFPLAQIEESGGKLVQTAGAQIPENNTVYTELRGKIATQYAVVQVMRTRIRELVSKTSGETISSKDLADNAAAISKELLPNSGKSAQEMGYGMYFLLVQMKAVNTAVSTQLTKWSPLADASFVTPSMTKAAVSSTTSGNAQVCSTCAKFSQAAEAQLQPSTTDSVANPWLAGLNSAVFRHLLEAHIDGTVNKVTATDAQLTQLAEFCYLYGFSKTDESLSSINSLKYALSQSGNSYQKQLAYQALKTIWNMPVVQTMADANWETGATVGTTTDPVISAARKKLDVLMKELNGKLDTAIPDWNAVTYNQLSTTIAEFASMGSRLVAGRVAVMNSGDESIYKNLELMTVNACNDLVAKIEASGKVTEFKDVKRELEALATNGLKSAGSYYEQRTSGSGNTEMLETVEHKFGDSKHTWSYMPTYRWVTQYRMQLGRAIQKVCQAEGLPECAAYKDATDRLPSTVGKGLSPTKLTADVSSLLKHFVKDHLKTEMPDTDPGDSGQKPPPNPTTPPKDKWTMSGDKADLMGWMMHRPGYTSNNDQKKSILDDSVSPPADGEVNPKFGKGNYNPGVTELTKKEQEVNFMGNVLAIVFYTVGEVLLIMSFVLFSMFVLVRTSGFIPASWFRFITFGKLDPYDLSIPKFVVSILLVVAFATTFVTGWAYTGATTFVAWLLTNFNII